MKLRFYNIRISKIADAVRYSDDQDSNMSLILFISGRDILNKDTEQKYGGKEAKSSDFYFLSLKVRKPDGNNLPKTCSLRF